MARHIITITALIFLAAGAGVFAAEEAPSASPKSFATRKSLSPTKAPAAAPPSQNKSEAKATTQAPEASSPPTAVPHAHDKDGRADDEDYSHGRNDDYDDSHLALPPAGAPVIADSPIPDHLALPQAGAPVIADSPIPALEVGGKDLSTGGASSLKVSAARAVVASAAAAGFFFF